MTNNLPLAFPTKEENESRRVNRVTSYVLAMMNREVPNRVNLAAMATYGDPASLEQDSNYLKGLIRSLSIEENIVVFGGHSEESLEASGWWVEQQ
tara:strand:- start:174 stop:458 length:285 start_codon:yes stop_codon:yes gene_type:complete